MQPLMSYRALSSPTPKSPPHGARCVSYGGTRIAGSSGGGDVDHEETATAHDAGTSRRRAGPPPLSDLSNIVFPMNLTVTSEIAKQLEHLMADTANGESERHNLPGHRPQLRGGVESIALNKQLLFEMQVEVNEYIESLDGVLKRLLADDNTALARQINSSHDTPATHLLVEVQRHMRKLSGDYNLQSERDLVRRLGELLDA